MPAHYIAGSLTSRASPERLRTLNTTVPPPEFAHPAAVPAHGPAAWRRWTSLALSCALLAFVFAHFISSAWPFAPVEGDDQNFTNGLLAWTHGWPDYRERAYLFAIQPGSYALLFGIIRATGADPFIAYAATSAVAAVLFLGLSTALLSDLSGVPWPWTALVLLSAEEINAAWSYPNTSTLAGALMLAALLIATRSQRWPGFLIGGVLIGLAGTLRLDALLIAPACWPLLAHQLGDWKTATTNTAKIAAVAVATLVLAYALGGVSFREAWTLYGTRGTGEPIYLVRFVPIALSGAILLAAACGTARLIQKADTACLAVLGLGIGPTLLAYGPNFTTPKYFYYAIPFAVFPALVWLRELAASPLNSRRRWLGLWGAFAVLEAFIGLRTTAPQWRRFDPSGAWATFFSIHLGNVGAVTVLGSGEIVGTADGLRLRTGAWHAPQVWQREKRGMLQDMARLHALDLPKTGQAVLTTAYLSDEVLAGELIRSGLRIVRDDHPFPQNPTSRGLWWSDGSRTLYTLLINHTSTDAPEFAAACARFNVGFFVNDRGREAARHLAANAPEWTCLSPTEDGLLSVYRRLPPSS